MSAEMAIGLIALVLSLATLGVVTVLLYRHEKDYASRSNLVKLQDHVAGELGRLQASQSQLYRYVEAVDAQAGGDGHKVLYQRVLRNHPEARER